MVRIRPHDFMERLIAAGLEVFGTKGFSLSRMSDVAKALGVSQGTLYNYVESKEALFGLLIERGADPSPVELPAEPIRAKTAQELAARLGETLRGSFALSALHRAVEAPADDAHIELEEILQELWATTEATRAHADALERSMPDLPRELQMVFFKFRRELFAAFAHYVGSRAQMGRFRDLGSPAVTARFLIENVTLFARHCRRDPDPTALPEGDLVRRHVITLLLHSLIPAVRS